MRLERSRSSTRPTVTCSAVLLGLLSTLHQRAAAAQPAQTSPPPTLAAITAELGEDISEADAAARFEGYLRARGGRVGPIWADHSHEERTANLLQHRASRQSARRRMQKGSSLFAGGSVQAKELNLAAVLQPTGQSSTCDDQLASNIDEPAPCTYDCADLQREYFPGQQSQQTRCFLFDPTSSTWPDDLAVRGVSVHSLGQGHPVADHGRPLDRLGHRIHRRAFHHLGVDPHEVAAAAERGVDAQDHGLGVPLRKQTRVRED